MGREEEQARSNVGGQDQSSYIQDLATGRKIKVRGCMERVKMKVGGS